jgi:putative FmdB family regulatory protein
MPLYNYECEKCGHSFEEWVKSWDDDHMKMDCPKCQSKQTAKKVPSLNARMRGNWSSWNVLG